MALSDVGRLLRNASGSLLRGAVNASQSTQQNDGEDLLRLLGAGANRTATSTTTTIASAAAGIATTLGATSQTATATVTATFQAAATETATSTTAVIASAVTGIATNVSNAPVAAATTTSVAFQDGGSIYAVASSVAINGAMLVFLVCAFGTLLCCKRLRHILAPRLQEAQTASRCPGSWVLNAWRYREELVSHALWNQFDPQRCTDLDAAVMVRFCMLGFKFSLAGTLVSFVLVPMYATGGEKEGKGFSRYNISNMEPGGTRYVVVVVAAYVLVLTFLHFAAVEWRRYIRLRATHLERLARGFGDPERGSVQAQRSVIVELVPRAARSQDGLGVRRFFEDIFPGQGHGVHSCVLQADTRVYYKEPAALLRSTGVHSVSKIRQALRLGNKEFADVNSLEDSASAPESGAGPNPGTPWNSEKPSLQSAAPSPGPREPAAAGPRGEPPGGPACPCGGQTTPPSASLRAAASAGGGGPPEVEAQAHAEEAANEAGFRPLEQLGGLATGVGSAMVDATGRLKGTACQAGAQLYSATDVLTTEMTEELKALGGRATAALEIVQDLTIGADGTDTAFVTFRSVADRVVAEQLVLSHSGKWLARAAPEARDVYWPNAAVSHSQVKMRTFIARIGVLGGLLFWSVPVASIQVWTTLDTEPPEWSQTKTGLFAYSILRKYLPVLGLMGLQYILPEVFRLLAQRFEQYKVKSQIDSIVLSRNIRYQFATLWVTVISSTGLGIHQHFEKILANPAYTFVILRTEVPKVAVFFLTFIAARVGLSLPFLLFKAVFSYLPPARTPRLTLPDYPREATNLALVLVLGLTYSVLAPAVMPICVVYFFFAFVNYCWLFRNVYTPEYDGGGQCWIHLFNASMVGLLVGTLTLAALCYDGGLASAYFYSLLMLSAIIVAAHVWFLRHFAAPSRFLSLEDACAVDRKCDASVLARLREDYYVDPILLDTPEAVGEGGGKERVPEAPEGPQREAAEPPPALPRSGACAGTASSGEEEEWEQERRDAEAGRRPRGPDGGGAPAPRCLAALWLALCGDSGPGAGCGAGAWPPWPGPRGHAAGAGDRC